MIELHEIWAAVFRHLWISTLFLVPVIAVAYVFRDASARLLDGVYSIGMLKLALPLPLIAPWLSMPWRELAASAEPGWVQTVIVGPQPIALAAGGTSSWLVPAWSTIWALGAGVCLVRLARRAAHRAEATADVATPLRVELSGIGLRSGDVLVTADGPGPYVRGIVQPRIVISETFLARVTPDELRAALLHERQHLRRRDTLRFALLGLARAVLWFYPPIWWLGRKLRESAELACDEAVARAGVPAEAFRRSLAHALQLGLAARGVGVPVGMLGHRGSFLKRRLQRIRIHGRWTMTTTQRASMIALAIAALALSTLPAGPPTTVERKADTEEGVSLSRVYVGPGEVKPGPAIPGKDGVTIPKRIPASAVAPKYPKTAREAKAESRVILQVLISETGKVDEIKLLSNTSGRDEFVDSAKAAVSQWRYEPAAREGKPVACYFTVVVVFSLDAGDDDAKLEASGESV